MIIAMVIIVSLLLVVVFECACHLLSTAFQVDEPKANICETYWIIAMFVVMGIVSEFCDGLPGIENFLPMAFIAGMHMWLAGGLRFTGRRDQHSLHPSKTYIKRTDI